MITIEKWEGLVTNASPYAVPGGAFVVQTNLQCIRPGQVQGRPGLQQLAVVGQPNVDAVAAARVIGGSTERVLVHAGTGIYIVSLP